MVIAACVVAAYLIMGSVIGTHFAIWSLLKSKNRSNPLYWILMPIGAVIVGISWPYFFVKE